MCVVRVLRDEVDERSGERVFSGFQVCGGLVCYTTTCPSNIVRVAAVWLWGFIGVGLEFAGTVFGLGTARYRGERRHTTGFSACRGGPSHAGYRIHQ